MAATVKEILVEITRVDTDLATCLDALYQQKYCGSFIVHCRNGVPQLIEFPGRRVHLQTTSPPASASSAPSSSLDKPGRNSAGSTVTEPMTR